MAWTVPAVAALLVLGACAGTPDRGPTDAASASPGVPTISALPMPSSAAGGGSGGGSGAGSGEGPPLAADLRRSSRDAARGQVQVWLDNGTGAPLLPLRVTYRDARLVRDVPAERLRTVPEGRELGFPVPLPPPACPADPDASARVVVVWAGGRAVVPVTDDNGTVAAYAAAGCDARRVARVARVGFRDEVPVEGRGTDARATMLLAVTPTGRVPGGSVRVQKVGGSPVLGPAGGLAVWRPRVRVAGDGAAQVVELPVAPSRCDSHAFLEAGGATAFRVALVVREPGRAPLRTELVLRVPPTGARTLVDTALEACGLTG